MTLRGRPSRIVALNLDAQPVAELVANAAKTTKPQVPGILPFGTVLVSGVNALEAWLITAKKPVKSCKGTIVSAGAADIGARQLAKLWLRLGWAGTWQRPAAVSPVALNVLRGRTSAARVMTNLHLFPCGVARALGEPNLCSATAVALAQQPGGAAPELSHNLRFKRGKQIGGFEFDDPQIGIEPQLPGDIGISGCLVDWFRAGCAHPRGGAIRGTDLRQDA